MEKQSLALDTCTHPLHKSRAILQNPRKSAVVVESYSGFESSLPDHFQQLILCGKLASPWRSAAFDEAVLHRPARRVAVPPATSSRLEIARHGKTDAGVLIIRVVAIA